MVKPKTGNLQFFAGRLGAPLAWILPVLALLSFIFSLAAMYPPRLVESVFARVLFPSLSHLAGKFADLISIAWLDVAIPVVILFLVLVIRKRKWLYLANVAAVLYLIF